MPAPEQLTQFINSPELALDHLEELLTSVGSDDENTSELANEALENCGTPADSSLPILEKCLGSNNNSTVYWSSTLIGRLGPKAIAMQDELASRMNSKTIDDAARERIVWSLGQLGTLSETIQSTLKTLLESASPRLKRLIENALAQ